MNKIKMVNLTKWVYKIRFCESWVLILIIWNLFLSSLIMVLVREDYINNFITEPVFIEDVQF